MPLFKVKLHFPLNQSMCSRARDYCKALVLKSMYYDSKLLAPVVCFAELVYVPIGMHHRLSFCPYQYSQERMKCNKVKNWLRPYCVICILCRLCALLQFVIGPMNFCKNLKETCATKKL